MSISADDLLRTGSELLQVERAEKRDHKPRFSDTGDQNESLDAVTSHEGNGGYDDLFTRHVEGGGAFGGRNNAAIKLVGLLRAKRFSYDTALGLIETWNERHCDPPLPIHDVRGMVSRAWVRWQGGEEPDATPEASLGLEQIEKPPGLGWDILTGYDLLACSNENGEVDWIVERAIARHGLHYLSAQAGGSKSWLLLWLVLCLMTGQEFLSKSVRKCRVAYVDEEMGQSKMAPRFRRIGVPTEDGFFYLGMQGIQLDNESHRKALIALCKERKIEVLIFDSLTRIHSKDENSNSDMRVLFKHFSQLIQEAGVTIIVTHHDRKSGGEGGGAAHSRMRGAGEIAAMCDMAFSVDKHGDMFSIKATKSRLVAEEDALRATYVLRDNEDRSRVWVETADLTTVSAQAKESDLEARVIDAIADGGKDATELRDAVRAAYPAVQAALRPLITEGRVRQEKVGRRIVYSLSADSEAISDIEEEEKMPEM